jgi:hypothetical protein
VSSLSETTHGSLPRCDPAEPELGIHALGSFRRVQPTAGGVRPGPPRRGRRLPSGPREASHETPEKQTEVLDAQEERTVDAMRRELDADERALETLARDHYVKRSITEPEFRGARGALIDRIAYTQARLASVGSSRGFRRLLEEAKNITPPWEVPPGTNPDPEELDEWRRWIAEAVEQVAVGSAVRGRNRFDPSRLTITWKV